jgi:hypothetical protein
MKEPALLIRGGIHEKKAKGYHRLPFPLPERGPERKNGCPERSTVYHRV